MSQKKPMKTMNRDMSKEKMPKKRIKKGRQNQSNSPNGNSNEEQSMPYNGTGTINIGGG